MSKRKTEVSLQQEIETQEEWEETLTKEGLIVIDVYQEWAGPCTSTITLFRRLRNELGDDLLKYAMAWAGPSKGLLNVIKDCLVKVEHDKMLKLAAAKADTIDSLERYRGKCEPCYLFYAGGVLVAVVRGANAPLLSKTILAELKQEHKVLNGDAERVEIRDPAFAHLDTEKVSTEDSDTENYEEAEMMQKEVTVALLKPDIVKEGKVEEVLQKMKESGIDILKHEERQLTEDEVKDFYSHLVDEPFFDELVQFMCSGPSHVLLLSKPDTGKGIIDEWRELIGPKKVEEAKEQAPDSLRAKYGTREMLNAFHGSDSHQSAIKELAFFFPEYQVPMVAKGGKGARSAHARAGGVQRTLALIRPDALIEKKDEILAKIQEAGFKIALQKEVQLTVEQAKEFYKEHSEQPYFDELIERMTKGPLMALGLARDDAVTEWRKLLGPKTVTEAKEQAPDSLRAQFSVDETEVNMIHGSDTKEGADQELNFFFPLQQTVAVIKPDAYESRDAIMDKIKEAGFHIAARKETQLTKAVAQLMYKNNAEAEYYNELIDHMSSGPSLFMVLTKEDAIDNWRGAIGPTDPNVAKEQQPDSLRAQFGTDIKANAIHAPSTEDSAKEVIKELFGDVVITTDGGVNKDSSELREDVVVENGPKDDHEHTERGPDGEEKPAGLAPNATGEPAESGGESAAEAKSDDHPAAEGTAEVEASPEAEQAPAASGDKPPEAEGEPAAQPEGDGVPASEPAATSEAEQAPVKTEQTSAELERAPAEAEQAPAEAEQAPAEAEQAPAEAEQTPTETEPQPASDDKPADSEATPATETAHETETAPPEGEAAAETGQKTEEAGALPESEKSEADDEESEEEASEYKASEYEASEYEASEEDEGGEEAAEKPAEDKPAEEKPTE